MENSGWTHALCIFFVEKNTKNVSLSLLPFRRRSESSRPFHGHWWEGIWCFFGWGCMPPGGGWQKMVGEIHFFWLATKDHLNSMLARFLVLGHTPRKSRWNYGAWVGTGGSEFELRLNLMWIKWVSHFVFLSRKWLQSDEENTTRSTPSPIITSIRKGNTENSWFQSEDELFYFSN